jgi:hypothetical protein
MAPTTRITTAGLGRIPTTFERRLISLLSCSSVQLPLVLEWQVAVGQDVLGGLLEQRGRARKAGTQTVGDFAKLQGAEA